ncbi:putative repeat protein (TIGR03847 family) [Spinactinospora alkalitolerans]|uniref:Putative repeat protein (TIGR03847 family) n=1 Tax=Spinactinospora alkalitolerans TaxID=687207 RepID=A0A852TTU1_9ACTN|nr:DUF3090 family protein [Spinactinospora alkalitolerans]NYE46895.1 putative repeat protein (TIGR03847 family) [Spinactinospora alkalitolerans]
MPVFQYDPPERFVAGTVGQPGERTFFLQATGGGRITSVVLEKAQVAALAERVEELLEEVRQRFGEQTGEPTEQDEIDDAPLEQPIEEDFRVGTMALAWDADSGRVIIEAQQLDESAAEGEGEGEAEAEGEEIEVFAEDVPEARDVLRVHLTPSAARAFAGRAMKVVAAGRPNCPLCGQPLDPNGHICPRQNGYKPIGL